MSTVNQYQYHELIKLLKELNLEILQLKKDIEEFRVWLLEDASTLADDDSEDSNEDSTDEDLPDVKRPKSADAWATSG